MNLVGNAFMEPSRVVSKRATIIRLALEKDGLPLPLPLPETDVPLKPHAQWRTLWMRRTCGNYTRCN